MNCAIYSRYSSDLQNDRSIDDQLRNCQRFADRQGWQIASGHIYSDRAVSGATVIGRSGLRDLLRAADSKPRPFDYILIDDTSRLSREQVEQASIIRDLAESGVYIYFVSDGIDTKDETAQNIILPIHGIKDSLYLRDLAKKTHRGMAGQVLNGYNSGGRTYGYHYETVPDPTGVIDKKTRQVKSLGTSISIDPAQAKTVRMIFSMYADGYGLKSICQTLNEQEIDPPGKARQLSKNSKRPSWCPNAIRNILLNPKYIGDWTWNKYQWIRKHSTGKRVRRPRPQEDWIEYKNPDLAIIERDLWRTVQGRFEDRKHADKSEAKRTRRKYFMSGLVKCNICGANLIISKSDGEDNIFYQCSFNWHRGATVCPNNIRIRKSDLENRVIMAIKDRILNPDIISIMVARINQALKELRGNSNGARRELVDSRRKISNDIQKLIALIAGSNADMPTVQRAIEDKESELAKIEAQIDSLEDQRHSKPLQIDPDYILGWLNRLEELIESDPDTARTQIADLIGTLKAKPIEVDGERALELTGKPKLDGILGAIGGMTTTKNSGGLQFAVVETDIPSFKIIIMAA